MLYAGYVMHLFSRMVTFEPALRLGRLTAGRSRLELITLASLSLAGGGVSTLLIPGSDGLFVAVLAILMIAVAAIDARYFLIPDGLTLLSLLLGILRHLSTTPEGIVEAMASCALRGIGFALPFLCLREFYRWARGRDGLGLGDVKLAAAGGVWLNWFSMPFAIEIAALSALSFYVARQHLSGRRVHPTMRLPFGLFFAPAIWITCMIEAMYWL